MEGHSTIPDDEGVGSIKKTRFKKTSKGPHEESYLTRSQARAARRHAASVEKPLLSTVSKVIQLDSSPNENLKSPMTTSEAATSSPIEKTPICREGASVSVLDKGGEDKCGEAKVGKSPPIHVTEARVTRSKSVASKIVVEKSLNVDKGKAPTVGKGKEVQSIEDDSVRFHTRMSPKGLCQLVKNLKEDESKSKAIYDIGFGSIMDMELTRLDESLCLWLVQNFDPYSRTLRWGEGKELVITEEDIHMTLGIPMGPKEVVEASLDNETEEFKELLESWRGSWGLTIGMPKTNSMPKTILERGVGDQFKRDFVIYLVSSFLNGKQELNCKYKVLFSLMNVEEIKNYNWCNYTLRGLIEGVEEWKSNPKRYFKGCITFLVLCYVDRIEFKMRDVPRVFPTYRGWSNTVVSKRVCKELAAGKFGLGIVVDRLKVDVGKKRPFVQEEGSSSQPISQKEFIQKLSSVTKRLASDYVEFGEILGYGYKTYPGSETVKKVQKTACDMFSSLSQNIDEVEVGKVYTSSQDEKYFMDSDVLDLISNLEEAYIKTTNSLRKEASVNEESHDNVVHESAHEMKFDENVGIDPSMENVVHETCTENVVHETSTENVRVEPLDVPCPSFSLGLTPLEDENVPKK